MARLLRMQCSVVWMQLLQIILSFNQIWPATSICPEVAVTECLPQSWDADYIAPHSGVLLSCVVQINSENAESVAVQWSVGNIALATTFTRLQVTHNSTLFNVSTPLGPVLNLLSFSRGVCHLSFTDGCVTNEWNFDVFTEGDLTLELLSNGTRRNDDSMSDIIIYTSVGGAFLLFLSVLGLMLLLFLLKKRRMRRHIHRLVDDMNNSYGSINHSTSLAQSYHHSRHFSSLGKTKKPPIFILYALELDTFQKVTTEDYPTYSLVLDTANLLSALNLPCYHDASEAFQCDSIQEFPKKVERAVTDAKAVIVICSEVLYTAFGDSKTGSKLAQMNFGKFSVLQVKEIMARSNAKFVPVTLTGSGSVCRDLQNSRYFNLQNYEQFMASVKKPLTPEVLNDPAFSEIRELCAILHRLLSVK